MEVKCGFSVLSTLNVKHDTNTGATNVADVKCSLVGVTANMNFNSYFDPVTKTPNKDGVKTITNTLIHALAGNIHYANVNGIRNDAEHLRFIIGELEKAFVHQVDVHTDAMIILDEPETQKPDMSWAEPSGGVINVPDEYEDLFNKVVNQLRFHRISGKGEALTAAHLISITSDFFNK